MPHLAFLARVRRMFTAPAPHLDVIGDACAKGTLKQPAQPMSDQELSRAIRDFQSAPPPEGALNELDAHPADPKSQR